MSPFITDLLNFRNAVVIGKMVYNPLTNCWQLPYRTAPNYLPEMPFGGISSVYQMAAEKAYDDLLTWTIKVKWSLYCEPCGPLKIITL